MEEKNINGLLDLENTLRTIANVVLWTGISVSIILFLTIATKKDSYGGNEWDPVGVGISIGTCLWSIMTWAVLRVISNISMNLFAIKDIHLKKAYLRSSKV